MVQFVFYKLNFASKEVLVAQETFSDRLRQAMSDRDVRQSDVIRASEMLGKKLGKSQMSQYVSGKTIPRRDVAELLARILEVDVTWLLAGDADQARHHYPATIPSPNPIPQLKLQGAPPCVLFLNPPSSITSCMTCAVPSSTRPPVWRTRASASSSSISATRRLRFPHAR